MKAEDLKNSILQMAMQGKLVPQDPNDEPVSVLLETIKEKKEQLIKEKKIYDKTKPSTIIKENEEYYEIKGRKKENITEEISFNIPPSWAYVRISTINDIYTGNSINKTEKESKYTGLTEGYNYIATKDVKFDNKIDYQNGIKIPENIEKFKKAPKNSILLCIEGGSAGRKIGFTKEKVCFGNKLCCFNNLGLYGKFLFYYLQSPQFKEVFKSEISGIIGGVGVGKIRKMIIPCPPFNEQKRIVEKLDQILPQIEQYDTYEQQLTKLNNELPTKLKKSILQQAIQGKLTQQNPEDEPASKLLEKIKEEKEQLIKEGKIKRNKNESTIYKKDGHWYEVIDRNNEVKCIDEEIPFEIPETWIWARLNAICTKITDGSHNPPPKKEKGFPVLSVKNIYQDKLSFDSVYRYCDKEGFEKENKRTNIKKGDLLLGIVGSIGSVAIYNSSEKVIAQRSLSVINSLINQIYLKYIFKTQYFNEFVKDNSKGTAQKGLYLNSLKKLLIPIPPLNEQVQIVFEIEKSYDCIK